MCSMGAAYIKKPSIAVAAESPGSRVPQCGDIEMARLAVIVRSLAGASTSSTLTLKVV